MSNKMKVTALAALAALVCTSGVFADDKGLVEFKTTISIEGAEKCFVDVSAAGQSTWALDWNFKEGDTTGTLKPGMGHEPEPLFVKVKVAEGSSAGCNLNAMKITGASTMAASADSQSAFRANTKDAYWRFMPVMAKLQLFTDVKGVDDGIAGAIDLNKVTVIDRAGEQHPQKSVAMHEAQAEVASLAEFKNAPAVALTHNYLANNGVLPLAGAGSSLNYTTDGLKEGESVKSALIGVGALVAKNPEAENGDIKLQDIGVGDEFSMPYTVSVTLK
jgi:hypothetical protein